MHTRRDIRDLHAILDTLDIVVVDLAGVVEEGERLDSNKLRKWYKIMNDATSRFEDKIFDLEKTMSR